jgi:hypothetical protein
MCSGSFPPGIILLTILRGPNNILCQRNQLEFRAEAFNFLKHLIARLSTHGPTRPRSLGDERGGVNRTVDAH